MSDDMDPELKKLFASMEPATVDFNKAPIPKPSSFQRDPARVQAELAQAIRDYAHIWRDKAAMEIQRAEALEAIAHDIQQTGCAQLDQAIMSQDWQRAYDLLEMRWHELKLRVQRLTFEHGNH